MTGTGHAEAYSALHRELRSLCDALEAVADSLPNHVDQQKCLRLAAAIGPLLRHAQQVEEGELFPALLSVAPLRRELDATLRQLRADHQLDLGYAEEVQDLLRSYGEGQRAVSPETAGFMLRGFFEALRRHIVFEEHLLVPLMKLVEHRRTRQGRI